MQSKQMTNAIFDSGNYTEKFEQDIVEAEKIFGSGIRLSPIGPWMNLGYHKATKRGLQMQIIPMRDWKNTIEVERRCAEEDSERHWSINGPVLSFCIERIIAEGYNDGGKDKGSFGSGGKGMTEIYYFEDDKDIANIVKEYLGQKGYRVSIFSTLAEARDAMEKHRPGLVLVDWNMPDGEGRALCQWIRSKWKEIPIIFLTVRNDTCDVVLGFRSGADDYVVKPFELEILYSRIRALLRRSQNPSGQSLTCGCISIDPNRMMVFSEEEEIAVSQAEYQLLLLLMMNKGRTVTRERLLEEIWDSNGNYVNDNTLTVTIKRLREKLRQPSCLKTIRSFGYRMEDEV